MYQILEKGELDQKHKRSRSKGKQKYSKTPDIKEETQSEVEFKEPSKDLDNYVVAEEVANQDNTQDKR